MIKFIKDEKGVVLVIFAILLPVLLGSVAIAVDLGIHYANKVKLDNIAQAAALAAVQELPGDLYAAEQKANEYITLNSIDDVNIEIQVSQSDKSVEVKIWRDTDYYFGKILGFETRRISSIAKAKAFGVTGLKGAAPLGVPFQNFVYGQLYQLKCGAPPEYGPGNFGVLKLNGNGANAYEDNLKYGHDGVIKIGDIIETESGNISIPTNRAISYRFAQDSRVPPNTINYYDRDAPQIIYVPVIEPYQMQENKMIKVKVIGFAAFFIASIPGNGNDSVIEGYFIETVYKGTGSEEQTDYGLRTTKLVNP